MGARLFGAPAALRARRELRGRRLPGVEELVLETSDGVRLVGSRRVPHLTRRAGVVVVHGFASSQSDPPIVELSELLASEGLEVLTYDARGHGDSGGTSTVVDREQLDVAAAVAELAPPVVVVGVSMGAIAALRCAALQQVEGLAGVVAVSAPASWRLRRGVVGLALLTRTRLGASFLRSQLGVRIERGFSLPEPPGEIVGRIRVPLAVVHGTEDRLLNPAEAQLLHAQAREPRRLDVVPGMGHGLGRSSLVPVHDALEWVLRRVEEPPA